MIQVSIYYLLVLCQPVAGSADRFEGFIVAAESQVMDEAAAVMLAVEKGGQPAEKNSGIQYNARLGTGSHYDCARKAAAMETDVLPCQERPHAVSQKKEGDVGIFFPCDRSESMQIGKNTFISVRICEISVILIIYHRFPVSQVVISDHIISVTVQKLCKIVITADKFAHAVADLQNSPDIALRNPLDGVDFRSAVF